MHGMLLLTVLAVVSAGCRADEGDSTSASGDPGPSQQISPPTIEEIGDATIEGIYDHPVLLEDGTFEGEPFEEGGASRPRVKLLDFYRAGDMNGSGVDETAAFLSESSGGSGTVLYLAIMGRHEEEIKNLGTALVGDRVQIRDARVEKGTLLLDVLQAGPDDAMCCPGELATRAWKLGGHDLVEFESGVPTRRMSVAELEGVQWTLLKLDWSDPYGGEPPITIVFDGERVAGSSGCNRYFAAVAEGDVPGGISVGQAGGTMMACPDEVMKGERRYLGALAAVSDYGFMLGDLVLTYGMEDGEIAALFFESGPLPAAGGQE
jgi:heat shock protein HslJ